MRAKEIHNLYNAATLSPYNPEAKKLFASLAKKLLRELNALLGIQADVRYNAGGIAVSGEATLHGDLIYVQIQKAAFGLPIILVRTCNGRKDYTGDRNTYFSFERLHEYNVAGLASYCEQLMHVKNSEEGR